MVTPLIPERTVNSIRALQLRTMPDTCVIYPTQQTPDGEGGFTITRGSIRDTVPCSFKTLAGRELERAQQVAAEADTSVKMPALTTVQSTDEFEVTRAEDGRVFNLQVEYVVQKSVEFATKVFTKDLQP